MNETLPTLQDVATAAGVSTATVSRAINQPDKVKEKSRNKINDAIVKLGYAPHGAARALASRRTQTIGAIVPTIDNGIFAKGIHYLQRGLKEANYTLLLASSNYNSDEELNEARTLISRGIDGMVMIGETHHPGVYELLNRHSIPVVNLWIYDPQSKYSCIGFDNSLVGRRIAEYLLAQGHKDIAVISGFQARNDRATQRVSGIRQFLQQQGLELKPELVRECRFSVDDARLAFQDLVNSGHPFTAVICGGDILALGALSAARDLGISVPESLSITGFDNLEICAALSPGLTTIDVPAKKMGKYAAEYLLKCIKNQEKGIHRMQLDADLIIRETSGPAPTR
ncbi:LacI family DNA-binding transcriptional regulator [Motiliproteus sp. MSK22-1]|uniref:LacI family DNA-binding transcriptional regulator n=1 Tax=Motiliproteus sp. MSK22-1 TaxID=1897630 RepID=UPI0009757138|nr:LacI family DNA-binding transcriptional regulator [Motiliproteus sp. MSK22-1]OMH31695.1 hypothetical protein BGP75_16350 [Motiliproteus sp. MSK22-1]